MAPRLRRRRRRPISLSSSLAFCVRACVRSRKLVVRVARGTGKKKKSVCVNQKSKMALNLFFFYFLFATPAHSGAPRAFFFFDKVLCIKVNNNIYYRCDVNL